MTATPALVHESAALPVLPLRDVVVFPHMVIPLFVGRDKSIKALDIAMEGDKRILLVAQKSAETDDPGAADLQDLLVDGIPLYQHVAKLVANDWNDNHNCLLVTGATYPGQLAEVRAIVGDLPLLVPGIGAQGGDVEAVLRHGQSSDGSGLLISSSRAILYAGNDDDFTNAARAATLILRDEINRHRKTGAG